MTNKIVAKYSGYGQWLFIAGVIFALLWFVSSFSNIITEPYLDFFSLIANVFSGGLFSTCLYFLLINKQVVISDRLIITESRFRRKVYKNSEIKGYKIRKYKQKSTEGEQIILKTANGYVCIDSNYFTSYRNVLKYVKSNYPHLEDVHFKRFDFISSLSYRLPIFGLACVFFILFYRSSIKTESVLANNINFVEVELSNRFLEVRKKSRKGRKVTVHYEFKSLTYPDLNFIVRGPNYALSSKSAIDKFRRGDHIKIGVSREEARLKILGLDEPGFWQKHWKWNEVEVHHIETDQLVVLNVHEVDRAINTSGDDNKWVVFGVGAFILGLSFLKNPIYS